MTTKVGGAGGACWCEWRWWDGWLSWVVGCLDSGDLVVWQVVKEEEAPEASQRRVDAEQDHTIQILIPALHHTIIVLVILCV